MIVLSRKPGDSIIIDDTIEIMIVQIKDDKVRLGVVAPKEIPVHRKEVHDALHEGEAGRGNHDANVLEIRQLARELEASRKETLKYKTLFWELVSSEWSSVTAVDLEEAKNSGFKVEHMIEELRRSSGA